LAARGHIFMRLPFVIPLINSGRAPIAGRLRDGQVIPGPFARRSEHFVFCPTEITKSWARIGRTIIRCKAYPWAV